MDGLAQSVHVNIARRLSCGLTIASCPLVGAIGCTFPTCARRVWSCQIPVGCQTGKTFGPLHGIGPPFVNLGVRSSGWHLDQHHGRHRHNGQRPSCSVVHFPVPAGSGAGVGDCHDFAILPKVRLFFPLCFSFSKECCWYGCCLFTTAEYASS